MALHRETAAVCVGVESLRNGPGQLVFMCFCLPFQGRRESQKVKKGERDMISEWVVKFSIKANTR